MKTIGDYEYGEGDKIGHGAFGIVYKGRNKKNLAQVVAIKQIFAISDNSKSLPDSINRETDILKTLSNSSHKNIVTLLHCEKQTDYIYFVMEFCNGGNLQDYLQSKQKLDESTIRVFLRQIAAGLKVAHDMHIVHRDLKPENIILSLSGPKYPSLDNITLKIADFGIGRFLDDGQMAKTLCGSPRYMAPEILLQRSGGYDFKVDLWSVGVIAYECLVGSFPQDLLIALHGFTNPKDATKDFVNLLQGLLKNDANERFTLKQMVAHQFLGISNCYYLGSEEETLKWLLSISSISVAVCGPSDKTTMIQVNDNQSVDHLIDIIHSTYKINVKDFCLMHNCGILEVGSSKSLRETGFENCSTVVLILKVRGGLMMARPAPQRCFGQSKCPKCKESGCWTTVGTKLHQVQN